MMKNRCPSFASVSNILVAVRQGKPVFTVVAYYVSNYARYIVLHCEDK